MILIEDIYLEDKDEKTRLTAEITMVQTKTKLWFETDKTYGKYLCFERADAFIVGLLPYAMKQNVDIHCNIPISEKLYYNLTEHFIPLLVRHNKELHSIKIVGKTTAEKLENENRVGTGNSGGVDSFYTIYRHSDASCPTNYQLTHVTFFNVGACGDFGGDKARQIFYDRINTVKPFAEKYQFYLLTLDSNISEILNMEYVPTHTYRNAAAVLALQKLFSIYYYSAGFTLNEFSLDIDAAARYDLFSLQCFSNENIQFYSTGKLTRTEKLKELVHYKPAQKNLYVCTRDKSNCSRCEKCIRTMLVLYTLNQLEIFRNVFDIEYFYKNKNKFLGMMLAYKGSNVFYKQIYEEMRKNNIFPSIKAFGYFPFYKVVVIDRNLKKSLIKNNVVKSIYTSLNR